MRCRAIVRQIRRNMNSDFALTLGRCAATLRRNSYILKSVIWRLVLITRGGRFRVHQRFFIAVMLSAFIVVTLAIPASSATKKIILDTDPGTDDAMALMLALNSPELDVRAVTVVPGNVTAKQGLENSLRMMSLSNRCDIPVAAGAQHPLFQKFITAEFWHGKNGLANIELPPSKCKVDSRYGPDLIIEMVHAAPHEITLVPVGPLTNIALAIEKDPSIVPLVKEVIITGEGSHHYGWLDHRWQRERGRRSQYLQRPRSRADRFPGRLAADHGRPRCRRQDTAVPEISRTTGSDS